MASRGLDNRRHFLTASITMGFDRDVDPPLRSEHVVSVPLHGLKVGGRTRVELAADVARWTYP
jgi:hypothetical protein